MNFYSYNFAALVGYVGCKPFYATAKGRTRGEVLQDLHGYPDGRPQRQQANDVA